MKILVIGGGNMGLTYAKSIAKSNSGASISIIEKEASKIKELQETTSFDIYNTVTKNNTNVEIILLAVKPQVIGGVFKELVPFITAKPLVISIMAGVTIQTISEGLKSSKVVRAMPNLPSQVGYGVTGFFPSEEITANDITIVEQILGVTGSLIKVATEDQIDAITALSGSGPAYVFYFMNAMMEQAKEFGFSETQAKDIVLNTFLGTTKLFDASEVNANTWIDRVTSKGGTTHAALTSFKNNLVANKIKEGTIAAYNRAKELSNN